MINIGTKRELLERLIVSELISKRGEGPLARKHFARVPRMLATAVPANEVAAADTAERLDGVVTTDTNQTSEPDEPKDPA